MSSRRCPKQQTRTRSARQGLSARSRCTYYCGRNKIEGGRWPSINDQTERIGQRNKLCRFESVLPRGFIVGKQASIYLLNRALRGVGQCPPRVLRQSCGLTSCPHTLLSCFGQGGMRTKSHREDPPDWIEVYRRACLPEPRGNNILQVLRHSLVPAPLVVWCRDRL